MILAQHDRLNGVFDQVLTKQRLVSYSLAINYAVSRSVAQSRLSKKDGLQPLL